MGGSRSEKVKSESKKQKRKSKSGKAKAKKQKRKSKSEKAKAKKQKRKSKSKKAKAKKRKSESESEKAKAKKQKRKSKSEKAKAKKKKRKSKTEKAKPKKQKIEMNALKLVNAAAMLAGAAASNEGANSRASPMPKGAFRAAQNQITRVGIRALAASRGERRAPGVEALHPDAGRQEAGGQALDEVTRMADIVDKLKDMGNSTRGGETRQEAETRYNESSGCLKRGMSVCLAAFRKNSWIFCAFSARIEQTFKSFVKDEALDKGKQRKLYAKVFLVLLLIVGAAAFAYTSSACRKTSKVSGIIDTLDKCLGFVILLSVGVVGIGFLFGFKLIELYQEDDFGIPRSGTVFLLLGSKAFLILRMGAQQIIPKIIKLVYGVEVENEMPEAIVAFVLGEGILIGGNLGFMFLGFFIGIDFRPATKLDMGKHFLFILGCDVVKTVCCYVLVWFYNLPDSINPIKSYSLVSKSTDRLRQKNALGIMVIALAAHGFLDAVQLLSTALLQCILGCCGSTVGQMPTSVLGQDYSCCVPKFIASCSTPFISMERQFFVEAYYIFSKLVTSDSLGDAQKDQIRIAMKKLEVWVCLLAGGKVEVERALIPL